MFYLTYLFFLHFVLEHLNITGLLIYFLFLLILNDILLQEGHL